MWQAAIMHSALHDLSLWDNLKGEERQQIAVSVAEQMAPRREFERGKLLFFRWEAMRRHAFGDQEHSIAHFRFGGADGAEFLLIPGSTIQLGYDRDSKVFPTEDDLASWQSYLDFDFPALRQFLDGCMTPLRQVSLLPFLIEAEAVELEDGCPDHGEFEEFLAECGFRLPSSDEWEFAYSGGTRCIFPWGNRSSRPDGFSEVPNALGFVPPSSSYCWELSSTPLLMRGGDGGVATCGGWGGLAEAITRACAYFDRPDETNLAHFRRVITVGG
jgi:hypothetical protein